VFDQLNLCLYQYGRMVWKKLALNTHNVHASLLTFSRPKTRNISSSLLYEKRMHKITQCVFTEYRLIADWTSLKVLSGSHELGINAMKQEWEYLPALILKIPKIDPFARLRNSNNWSRSSFHIPNHIVLPSQCPDKSSTSNCIVDSVVP